MRLGFVRRFYLAALLLSGLLCPFARVESQANSSTVAAFRAHARDVAERIRLPADAMPEDQYNYRPRPSFPTFVDFLMELSVDYSRCTAGRFGKHLDWAACDCYSRHRHDFHNSVLG
jgi:hypothetical protein